MFALLVELISFDQVRCDLSLADYQSSDIELVGSSKGTHLLPGEVKLLDQVSKINEQCIRDVSAETELRNSCSGLLSRIASAVNERIAPSRSYIELVTRITRWFVSYDAIKEEVEYGMDNNDKFMPSAIEIFKQEYAKVDEILSKEEMVKLISLQQSPVDPSQIETVDYVFKAIKMLVDRLEKQLASLEEDNGELIFHVGGKSALDQLADDERLSNAMGRFKRVAARKATDIVQDELISYAKLALLHQLFVAAASKPGVATDYINYFLGLVGGTSGSAASLYWKIAEIRAANVILNSLNPIPIFAKVFQGDRKYGSD